MKVMETCALGELAINTTVILPPARPASVNVDDVTTWPPPKSQTIRMFTHSFSDRLVKSTRSVAAEFTEVQAAQTVSTRIASFCHHSPKITNDVPTVLSVSGGSSMYRKLMLPPGCVKLAFMHWNAACASCSLVKKFAAGWPVNPTTVPLDN